MAAMSEERDPNAWRTQIAEGATFFAAIPVTHVMQGLKRFL
jgi:hypothetical protein